jgi:hypothetical protein
VEVVSCPKSHTANLDCQLFAIFRSDALSQCSKAEASGLISISIYDPPPSCSVSLRVFHSRNRINRCNHSSESLARSSNRCFSNGPPTALMRLRFAKLRGEKDLNADTSVSGCPICSQKPLARGELASRLTLAAPALSPPTVMRFGSPSKNPTFSFNHFNANIMSSNPKFPGNSRCNALRNPKDLRSVNTHYSFTVT